MQHSIPSKTGANRLVAGAIVAGVLGASALVRRRNAPEPGHPRIQRWYRRLDKPGFTPPDEVFGAVWPALETGMAVGGYRLLRAPPSSERNAALALWLGTSAMIGGWTELFFRKRDLTSSSAAAAAMMGSSAAYVATAARVDRPAALAGVPLTGWLVFATVLAESVRRRNR
jgi:tryptophan-rich sensory protein